MTTITQVRVAMAAALGSINGLRCYAFGPDSVNVPAAVVIPAQGAFLDTVTFEGADDFQITVRVIVAKTSDRVSQENLDPYLSSDGAKSIEAAMNLDPTLGGIVDFVVHNQVENYGYVTWNGVDYLGADMGFTVGA